MDGPVDMAEAQPVQWGWSIYQVDTPLSQHPSSTIAFARSFTTHALDFDCGRKFGVCSDLVWSRDTFDDRRATAGLQRRHLLSQANIWGTAWFFSIRISSRSKV